jgi:acetylornithine aminotransferase
LIGIQLTANLSAQVEESARAAGYLVNPPKPDVIRLAPPLILTAAQAESFVADLPGILDAAGTAARATGPEAAACVTTEGPGSAAIGTAKEQQ